MTRIVPPFLCLLLAAFAAFPAGAQDADEMSDKEKASYSVGVQFGHAIEYSADRIDIEALMRGLEDAMRGNELQLSDEEINAQMMAFQQAMMEDRSAGMRKEGEAFLAQNAEQEGVHVTGSGLQYKVLEEGTGETPTAQDTVVVHYRGTFVDGTEFDSSYQRNQPAQFGVTQVIPGWTEALQMMKEGAKWKVWIPYDLAYGEQGRQGIPPYSTLIFEVELLEIADEGAEQ